MTVLADMPTLEPLDILRVSGPLAVLMILAELACYWRWGRTPARREHRLTVALAVAAGVVPAAVLAIVHWHVAALLIIGLMLILWATHSYQRTTSPLSRLSRAVCVAIRIAVILLVMVYLLRPSMPQRKIVEERAVLFVLYDASRSMTIADAGAGHKQSRMQAVREAFAARARRMADLERAFELKQFLFSDGPVVAIKQVEDLPAAPDGESTAIGKSIDEATKTAGGQPVAAVIVVSDGVNNLAGPDHEPLRVAARLAGRSTPVAVCPVGVGSETPAADKPVVIAQSIKLSARRVAAFNILTVTAEFDLINLPGQPLRLELVFGHGQQAEVVDRKVVSAASGNERVTVNMELTPTVTGFHPVTVRLAEGEKAARGGQPLASELSRITDYVQVVDDVMQVLYVEGKFRLEARSVIAALAGSDLLRLHRQFVLTSAALDSGGVSQLPRSREEWRRYHVVILGDIKADAFTAEDLRTIREMVEDLGKGLMVIGGRDAFGQGGWPGSPLAGLMPFDLRKASGHLTEPFKLTATPQGLTHQLMRLEEDAAANAQRWNSLPTIQGANRFPPAEEIRATRPGAIVLATTPTGQPVMVAQEVGKGRVLAMAIDTTWRWRLHLEDGDRLHGKFWRQAVQWLANRKGNVWVKTNEPRYRFSRVRLGPKGAAAEDRIVVNAGAEDPTGKPLRPPDARLTLLAPADERGNAQRQTIELAGHRKGDQYELVLPPPARPGSYRLLFEATVDGQPVQEETSFLVEAVDVELARPLADHNLLRQMAREGQAAGGRFYTLDQLDDLLERFQTTDYLVRRPVDLPALNLADQFRWPILLLVLIGLMGEWIFRKSRSLV